MIVSRGNRIETNKEYYFSFPYGIWLPNYDDQLIDRIHGHNFHVERLDHHNDILYINGKRVRTQHDPGSHPCYNCGHCIDNGIERCQRKECERDCKERNLCLRQWGRGSWIHKIERELTFPKTRKGVSYNIGYCQYCHKDVVWLADYEQDQHVIDFTNHIKKINRSLLIEQNLVGRVCFSGKFRHSVLKLFNYRCKDCGATKDDAPLEIDHIIPISKGGSNRLDNLQVLCKTCNRSKHTDAWEAGK